MPRLDLQYRNKDIAGMIKALRDQTQRLVDELGMLQLRMELVPADDTFQNAEVRDRMTDVSLIAQNLSGEATAVWKRTR